MFCVREEKGIHSDIWVIRGWALGNCYLFPTFFSARCEHVTNFWQLESELKWYV